MPNRLSKRLDSQNASLRRFCKLNNDSRYDTCEAPQEIDNDEIDILLKAQQDAEEQGRGDAMVPGLPSGGWNAKQKKTGDHGDAKVTCCAAALTYLVTRSSDQLRMDMKLNSVAACRSIIASSGSAPVVVAGGKLAM